MIIRPYVILRGGAALLLCGRSDPGLGAPGRLVHGPQAAGADLDASGLAVDGEGLLVDVGLPPGLGLAVGVAHVVAGHPGLSAHLALHDFCPCPLSVGIIAHALELHRPLPRFFLVR